MRCNLVKDVTRKNNILSIPVSPAHRLSALVWTCPAGGSVLDAQYRCLGHALQKLTSDIPSKDLWLIAGHATWQLDNRITRHNGLWKSLEKRGVIIPQGKRIKEAVQSSAHGIRFFGAVCCNISQVKAIHAVMRCAQAALLLLPKPDVEGDLVRLLVQKGWEMINSNPPEEILVATIAQSGLIVEVYGNFDDPDISVAAFGKEEMLTKLLAE